MHPVIFDKFQDSQEFKPYTLMLYDFSWRNRIVGSTKDGLLCVDDKFSNSSIKPVMNSILKSFYGTRSRKLISDGHLVSKE